MRTPQSLRLDAARERGRLAGLGADSVQAAADSGRSSFYIRVQKLGDSLRVAERRAVQTVQRADVLDRVLRLEQRVRDSLRVAVERLRRQARRTTSGARRSMCGRRRIRCMRM